MSDSTASIVRRFDALHLRVELFSCTDGTVGASVPGAEIRAQHTINSFVGYGETAELAVLDLWKRVLDMDSTERLRVMTDAATKRYYQWNGAAWKERSPADFGEAA
jgi:hypothetical protein